jgi:lipopolysaccharide export system protein LptC
MTAIARTETAEQRAAIYAGLIRRNRVVGFLRASVPAIGVMLLAALLVQFFLGSITPNFGFANITIDRDNLVVDAPAYSGVGAGGTVYEVAAGSARAAIGDTDLIHLTDATFEMVQPSGTSFSASAPEAQIRVSSQLVDVAGTTTVSGNNGLSGTVVDAHIDLIAEKLVSDGAADLTFSGGSHVRAARMTFDNKLRVWTFHRATLTMPAMPGSEQERALQPGETEP